MRVYVPGTFDCLHVGHLNLLDFAATLGEVWVGLNTDEFAERYKRRPVYSLKDRIRIIESLRQVDEVIVNYGDEDSKPAILECGPRFIIHGDDWPLASYLRQLDVTEEWLAERGIEIIFPPYTVGVSTTRIIAQSIPSSVDDRLAPLFAAWDDWVANGDPYGGPDYDSGEHRTMEALWSAFEGAGWTDKT